MGGRGGSGSSADGFQQSTGRHDIYGGVNNMYVYVLLVKRECAGSCENTRQREEGTG